MSTTSDQDESVGSGFLIRLRAELAEEVAREVYWGAAELILASPLLDSIPARLERQFGDLDRAGAEDVFADALEALIVYWEKGGRPDRPDSYLWRTCWNMAQDEVGRRRDLAELDGNRTAAPDAESLNEEVSRETLRREALRVAREALPRIAQERPREALALILDAVERGVELTNATLGERLGVTSANARKLRERAFKRLEEALAHMGAYLTLQWAFELEEREADGQDDQEDHE